MIKNLYLFGAMCIAILLFGCESTQGQDIAAVKLEGNMATVELKGNPTTGYTWLYTMSPEGIVREIFNDYIPDKTDENIVGSGGKFVFSFEAVSQGEAELVFSYLRVWEKDIPALETITYRAVVDDKGNLTLTKK